MVIKQGKGGKALKHTYIRFWKMCLWFYASTVVLLKAVLAMLHPSLSWPCTSSFALSFYQCTRGLQVPASVTDIHLFLSPLPVAQARGWFSAPPAISASWWLFASLKTNGQGLQLQLWTNTATAVGPKPQVATTAPFPILMNGSRAAPWASQDG